MKELGITKGEWIVDHNRIPNGFNELAEQIAITCETKDEDEWCVACVFTDITDEGDEEKNNAILIADAGNTAHKCGLLPSELLQQRDDAVDKVETLVGYLSIMALGKNPPELEAVIKEANEWIEITKAEER